MPFVLEPLTLTSVWLACTVGTACATATVILTES